MTEITTRAGKGAPLTNTEVDANFTNLNNDKLEKTGGSITANSTDPALKVTQTGAGNALDVTGNITVSGNTTLGDASTDTVTVNGYMGVGGAANSAVGVYAQHTALTGTTQVGVYSSPVGTSSATVAIRSYAAQPQSSASSFTVSDVIGFNARNATKGAGSTITNQHGLLIDDQTQGTNNYGITSQVSSGTNKWNIYASGTAANYFVGFTKFGGSGVPSVPVDVEVLAGANTATRGLWIKTADLAGSTGNSGVYLSAPYASGTVNEAFFRVKRGAGNVYNGAEIASSGAFRFLGSLTEDTSERMRIDSAGNVGIGTSSPSAKLEVSKGSEGEYLRIGGDDATNARGLRFTSSTNNSSVGALHTINAASTSGAIALATNSTERLRIDSAGYVSLSAATPKIYQTTAADRLCITGANDGVVTSGGTIFLRDDTAATNAGGIEFWTGTSAAGTERLRIDSLGNLGLGVTPSAWGAMYKAAEIVGASISSSTDYLNGSFQTNGYFDGTNWRYKVTGSACRYLQSPSYGHALFAAPSGTAGDPFAFTQVLAVAKDKSLALQGATSQTGTGITFPATQVASSNANTLDDYREGTFTPTIVGTTVAGAGTYTAQVGTYTRVGRLVTFTLNINWTAHTGGGNLQLNGLPFTSQSLANQYPVCNVISDSIALTAGSIACAFVPISSTSVVIRQIPTGGGAYAVVPMDTTGQLLISGHYEV